AAHVGEAGKMELPDMPACNAVDVGERIPAVVRTAHVDIVDVEEDAAAGALGKGVQKLGLGHLRAAVLDVRRRVLEQDAAPEKLLHLRHSYSDVREGFLGVRH